jgi:hypothetical protein
MIGTKVERPGRVALALAALAAACLFAVLAVAPERAGAAQVSQIGQTKRMPNPDCPNSPCLVEGHVTGFQTAASGVKHPYVVPKDGSIVAWSIDVSRPTKKQRKAFGKLLKAPDFGTAPTARLAVLTKAGKKGSQYKLRRQTPVANLTNVLGTTPIFSLKSALRVKKGDVIALTVPTWAPMFATDQPRASTWRASRAKSKCGANDVPTGKPQTKTGSTRAYGCNYTTNRLLYWAYFVKS